MSDRYGVMGNPIKHSKSPQIHAAFARQLGEALEYEALLVETDEFPQAVSAFFAQGGCGLNVTVPFKQEAWTLAEQLSDAARLAGAVNTLYLDEQQRICGANTDGIGMVRDLEENHGISIEGRRVLVLGAGGAVRGVLEPLLAAGPFSLRIANRTPAKAQQLAEDFSSTGPIRGGGYADLEGPYDLVINGTSASLQGELPPLPDDLLAPGACCYDMMYGAEPTPFIRWARQHGAHRALDGLGMLVEQAAESFHIWRGRRPHTGPVIQQIRDQLGG